VPVGRSVAVEFVSVTTEVPGVVQAAVAEVPVIATGKLLTVIDAVLLDDKLVVHKDEFVKAVIVIVDEPAVVKPVAVKVPVPAVETVIVAVNPVCDGDEVL
jgi:acetyl/propionyl-CoA carboxylase alpha subunit